MQGQIRRGFGAQPNGARSDGLDIVASEGTLVVAADAGVVTYAGSELQGYGKMLLIAHAGGLTTIYAHNQALLVGVGAQVQRGQPIATVGRTGDVDDPQLHFQLRAGNRPVDPTAYLEAKRTMVASLANGEPTPEDRGVRSCVGGCRVSDGRRGHGSRSSGASIHPTPTSAPMPRPCYSAA